MQSNKQIEDLFEAGAHFGFKKTRRHPSVAKFLYGAKAGNDIFDLEKTVEKLEEAKDAAYEAGQKGKQILFVGSKNEAKGVIKAAAERAGLPYVTGRWIGGTLTNFKEIRRRVDRLEQLLEDKEKGNLDKYTKKERLLLDREMDKLNNMFGGIVDMRALPALLFAVDPLAEHTAMREARHLSISTMALANTDCNFDEITYSIPGNDSALKSIDYFVNAVTDAYEEGKKSPAKTEDKKEEKEEVKKAK